MKKKKLTAGITAIIMACMSFIPTSAFAEDYEGYLSLGADLSDSQKTTVLKLLGVQDIEDYDVSYVTNKEEHEYLNDYVPDEKIGKSSLSSVLIKENDTGTIKVETKNINYCTSGMYENALKTAGMEGADVTVAGPFEISGTAALVGTIKAYEKMTGKEISDDVTKAAVNEMTTTGDLGEEIGDTETAETIINEVKTELAENPDMSSDEIRTAIADAAENEGVTISEQALNDTQKMFENLQDTGISWESLKEKSKDKINEAKVNIMTKLLTWIRSLV